MRCDVLIAGAGPTGLMLALELARRGIACRLIDAAEHPFAGSRGKGLQPRTLEIFDQVGAATMVADRAMLYPKMKVHVGPFAVRLGSLGTSHTPSPELPWPNLLMLPQWRTEEALRARLAELGVEPEWGRALESFQQDDAGVTAKLASRETVHAPYLVGCDGGRSVVRKICGIGLVGETLDDKERVVADLEIAGLDRGYWHNWLSLAGVIAISPLPEPDLFQLQAPATLDADNALGGLKRATGYAPGTIHWKSRFHHQTRMAEHFHKGRVLIAGDAAHLHPPSGGQGLNTSVQDAFNLGWKLAMVLRGADLHLLEMYSEERMAVAAGMLKLTGQLQRSGSTKRGDSTNQLDVHYRGSRLSVGPAALGVHPGDRMPNLALEGGTRVFDQLRTTTGGLRLHGSPDGPITVRPDGYVAAIGNEVPTLLADMEFVEHRLVSH